MTETVKAPSPAEPRRPRGRPRAEDLHELETRLIRVGLQCFTTAGYGATSMSEVARAARVSKGTLYARFATKADLFRAILEAQIRATGGVVRLRGPRPKSLEAALRSYAELTLQESLSAEIVALNRLIYSEAGRFPELGEAAWARNQVGVRQVCDYIRDFAAADDVPCRDPQRAAELFITLLHGWYGRALLRARPVTPAEVRAWTDGMLQNFLAGRSAW